MKRFTGILALMTLVAGSVFAKIMLNTPAPIEMIEAYPLVVKALGTNAAQYHCMSAIPWEDQDPHINYTNHVTGEWQFFFVTSNHESELVWVYFDGKKAEIVHPRPPKGF